MKKMKKYIILIVFLLISFSSFSQTACRDDLAKAIELYNSGLYEKTIELLETKIKTCKYKGSEKKQALKYLAAAYYEIDEIEKADKSTHYFLRKDPLYEAQTTDPVLFAEALNKYERYPSLSLGFRAGISTLNPYIKEIYTIWDNADYTQDYMIEPTTSFTFILSKSLMKNLNINLDFTFAPYAYSRNIPINDTTFINYREEYIEIKVPLELSYSFRAFKKFYPSIYAGVYYSRYMNTQGSLNGSKLSLGSGPFTEFLKTSFAVERLRNVDNVGLTLGLGLNYRLNRFTILTKLSYSENALDYTKKEKGVIPGYEINTYYTNDLFSIRTLTYSIGLKYTFSYRIKSKY